MKTRPAWTVINHLWSTLTLRHFSGRPCGWPIFHLLFVSDPGELHRVSEGLALGLLQPPKASHTHMTQPNLLLCSPKRKLQKEPSAQTQTLNECQQYNSFSLQEGASFSSLTEVWATFEQCQSNPRLLWDRPWCLRVPAREARQPRCGAHLLRGSRGPSTVILMALW